MHEGAGSGVAGTAANQVRFWSTASQRLQQGIMKGADPCPEAASHLHSPTGTGWVAPSSRTAQLPTPTGDGTGPERRSCGAGRDHTGVKCPSRTGTQVFGCLTTDASNTSQRLLQAPRPLTAGCLGRGARGAALGRGAKKGLKFRGVFQRGEGRASGTGQHRGGCQPPPGLGISAQRDRPRERGGACRVGAAVRG